jgi:hypothetical protein
MQLWPLVCVPSVSLESCQENELVERAAIHSKPKKREGDNTTKERKEKKDKANMLFQYC